MPDASSALAKLGASLFTALTGRSYAIRNGALFEQAAATLPDMATSVPDTTAEFDFLTLTVPSDLEAGAMFEAQFFGMQSQAAAANTLVFYAKVNGGAAVIIASVSAGSSAQSFRAMSGRAALMFPTVGASGTYYLAGELSLNSVAPQSSNSATPRAVDTRAGMTITLGMRCTAANAANINRFSAASIRQVK